MNELSQYIRYRIERLKKTDGLITLSLFMIGVIIGTWEYGLEPTLITVFIFTSGMIFAEFISTSKFYLSRYQKKSDSEKGRVIFTLILLTAIAIIQLVLWDRFVTIYSLGIGITFGIIIIFILKTKCST